MLSALASALSAGLGIVARILICRLDIFIHFRLSQSLLYIFQMPSKHYLYTVNVLTAPLHPRKVGKGPVVALGAAAFLLLAVLSKYLGSRVERE